jgi:hypothetical protein
VRNVWTLQRQIAFAVAAALFIFIVAAGLHTHQNFATQECTFCDVLHKAAVLQSLAVPIGAVHFVAWLFQRGTSNFQRQPNFPSHSSRAPPIQGMVS